MKDQIILSLLEEALQLDSAERGVFLDRQCAGRPEIRKAVAARLALDPSSIFEDLSPLPRISGQLEDNYLGAHLGSYRLESRLGQGGMGVVYLAHHPYQGKVAVKILKRGLDTDQFLRRFQTERQILTRLNHPNIAQILDGGSTPEGRPYFVMEYVCGVALHRFCLSACASIDGILGIFMKVCDAVQTAHQSLVIHRDLKPGNILVTESGEPKLLDFGIAKLLEPDLPQTETGLRPMTREYASPEQIKGQAITTASDVYALGVMLYELLTGSLPYEGQILREEGLERAILHQDPPDPGRLVVKAFSGSPRFPNKGAAKAWAKSLKGDLTAILGKALRKNPRERYVSPHQLRDELELWRQGRPIQARKSTYLDRAAKWIKRNPWPSFATAAVALIIMGFTPALIVEKNRVARQRDRAEKALTVAEQAREEALRQRRHAEQVSEFMINLFRNSDPFELSDEPLSTQQLLEQAVREIRDKPVADKAIKASWLAVLGRVHGNLKWNEEALPLLEEAVALNHQHFGFHHPETIKSTTLLAQAQMALGQYEEADKGFHDVLAVARDHPDWDAAIIADIQTGIGQVALYQARYETAEKHLETVHHFYAKDPGLYGQKLARIQSDLAVVYKYLSKWQEAEILARQALEQKKAMLGENHPDVSHSLNNLAMIHVERGQYARAEPLFQQSLAIIQKNYGEDHLSYSYALNNLAGLCQLQGRKEEALAYFQKILPLWEKKLGPEHPTTAFGFHNTAQVYYESGEYQKAEPLYRRALAIRGRVFGKKNPHYASSLKGLALNMAHQNRHDQALVKFQEVLEIERETLGVRNPHYLATLNILAGMMCELGQFEEAEHYLNHALQVWESYGEHPFKRNAVLQAVELARKRKIRGDEVLACAHLLSFQTVSPPPGSKKQLIEDCFCLLDGMSEGPEAE